MSEDGDAKVEDADGDGLSAWSRVLPPGWLDRYRADLRGSLSTQTPAAATPAGSAIRSWRTTWSSPVVARAAAVGAGLLAVGLLLVSSALPADPDPRREPAPLRRPRGSAPILGNGETITTPPARTPTPTPAGRAAVPGGRAQPGGLPTAVPASPRWGYAWMDQAISQRGVEVRLDPQWQWTTGRDNPATAGRRVTAVHNGTGAYTVRLPGAGFPMGTAHATSFATASRYYYAPADDGHSCAVAGYRQSGSDELLDIRCHNRYGALVDVQFDVFFAAPNTGPGPYAAVRYDAPGGLGTRAPIYNSGTWNTTGGTLNVYQQDTGRWRVVLSGAALAADRGYVHVTAFGTGAPARCRPVSTTPSAGGRALQVVVACDAITTAPARPVNSQWTLTYTGGAGLHHTASVPAAYATTAGDPARPVLDRRRSWTSNAETPNLTRLGVGAYRLTYRTLGTPNDAPQVTAIGALPRHCRLYWWDSYSDPPRVTVDIYCYDTTGDRADALFAMAYLRRP